MSSTYTRNKVYTYVYNKVISSYPSAYISSKYEPVVANFPAVFVREIGNFSNPANVTLSGIQDVWTSTFEVQIQSNDANTPATEAYNILSVVDGAFTELFYVKQAVNVIDNGITGAFRLVATYRRVTGIADTMPIVQT